jgi:hypothetical protein
MCHLQFMVFLVSLLVHSFDLETWFYPPGIVTGTLYVQRVVDA